MEGHSLTCGCDHCFPCKPLKWTNTHGDDSFGIPVEKGPMQQDIEDLKEEIASLKKENAKLKTRIETLAHVTGVKFVDLEKPEIPPEFKDIYEFATTWNAVKGFNE